MFIKDVLKLENVEIIDSVKDWKDAIYTGTKKLEEQGYITHRYPEAIIENVEEHGAYFVLCPDVALLHASSSEGVNETQLAINLVKEPFRFEGKDEDVRLMITLAATDSESHIGAMQQIAILLGDDAKLQEVLAAETAEELFKLFTEAETTRS